jgi:RNA polymerase sigma-70 factor (ECF subfamily)
VEQELQQVPEPYRTTVVLRDIEGLSYEEIAEILEISLGTVKSRLIRGRDALKKRLETFVQQMNSDARNCAGNGLSVQTTGSRSQAKWEAQS